MQTFEWHSNLSRYYSPFNPFSSSSYNSMRCTATRRWSLRHWIPDGVGLRRHLRCSINQAKGAIQPTSPPRRVWWPVLMSAAMTLIKTKTKLLEILYQFYTTWREIVFSTEGWKWKASHSMARSTPRAATHSRQGPNWHHEYTLYTMMVRQGEPFVWVDLGYLVWKKHF